MIDYFPLNSMSGKSIAFIWWEGKGRMRVKRIYMKPSNMQPSIVHQEITGKSPNLAIDHADEKFI
jgi:hypothetical protein